MAADQQSKYSDIDYYAAAPDTLAVAAASSESLARVVGGDVFGIYWSSFGGNGKITSADGYNMTGRADGVQDLATATYSTFKAVEAAVSNPSADPLVLQWLEQIYDQLYHSTRSGDQVTKTSIADLLAERSPGYFWYNGSSGQWSSSSSVPEVLAHISTSLGNSVLALDWIDVFGRASSGQLPLGQVTGRGFTGLAYLLFGSDSHDIQGLSWLGKDVVGHRGSWSFADITANGFQGLATLIGGLDDGQGRRAVWQWIDPTDPLDTSKIRNYEVTSLFDLFHQIAWLQNSLAKLEYVYASEEDMEFKQQEKPNLDAVKDSFFGDGEGAVNPDQIKDAAGISSAAKDAFGGAGSPGDAFTAINDSQSFWFFSQEVADALDTVNAAALASEEEDDFMDQFVQDEDGFYSLIDLSPWDVSSYLRGER